MMKENKDQLYIEHIVEAVDAVEKFISGSDYNEFKSDDLLQSGVMRKLEIIGEAAKNISTELKKKYPQINWRKAAGARDVIIHAYFSVDIESIWNTVKNDLPTFKKELLKIKL